MPTSHSRFDAMTALALATLGLVLVGIVLLTLLALIRRWQQQRHSLHVQDLGRRYTPLLYRWVLGTNSARHMHDLLSLSLSDWEILLEPILSSKHSEWPDAIHLQQLCRDLGLIEIWQQRLATRRGAGGNILEGAPRRPIPSGRSSFLVRARAARNLGAIRHQPSWRLLMAALDDPHSDVRTVALRSLGVIREPQSFPLLVSRLLKVMEGACPYLFQHTLKAALAAFPLSHIPELEPALRDPQGGIRALAAEVLLRMVEREAARNADFVLPRSVFPRELDTLALDSNPEVRGRIAEVLKSLDDPSSTALLCKLLEDSEWFVRLRAIRALNTRRHLAALPEVVRCLADIHPRVREAAVETLLALRPEGFAEALRQFLENPAASTRELILKGVEGSGLVPVLIERWCAEGSELEGRVIEQLLAMGTTHFLEASPGDGEGATLLKKLQKQFGQHPDPKVRARVRSLSALPEGDIAGQHIASPRRRAA